MLANHDTVLAKLDGIDKTVGKIETNQTNQKNQKNVTRACVPM